MTSSVVVKLGRSKDLYMSVVISTEFSAVEDLGELARKVKLYGIRSSASLTKSVGANHF